MCQETFEGMISMSYLFEAPKDVMFETLKRTTKTAPKPFEVGLWKRSRFPQIFLQLVILSWSFYATAICTTLPK